MVSQAVGTFPDLLDRIPRTRYHIPIVDRMAVAEPAVAVAVTQTFR